MAGAYTSPGGMTPAQFQFLCNIGMDAIQPAEVLAIAAYAELWLAGKAPNQLIHTDEAAPPFELGYATYAEAKSAWAVIK